MKNYEKYQNFYLKNFLVIKFSVYLNRRAFVMILFYVAVQSIVICELTVKGQRTTD